jgi:hypothetical protein
LGETEGLGHLQRGYLPATGRSLLELRGQSSGRVSLGATCVGMQADTKWAVSLKKARNYKGQGQNHRESLQLAPNRKT